MSLDQIQAISELLHHVGKYMVEQGEQWRLDHPELVDAYQNLFGILSEDGRSGRDDRLKQLEFALNELKIEYEAVMYSAFGNWPFKGSENWKRAEKLLHADDVPEDSRSLNEPSRTKLIW